MDKNSEPLKQESPKIMAKQIKEFAGELAFFSDINDETKNIIIIDYARFLFSSSQNLQIAEINIRK